MHTIIRNLTRKLWRQIGPLRFLLGAFGSLCLALLAAPGSASAQTFVAEWAEADIGRIGPTGMALDTVNNVTTLYVADDPGGRIIAIDATTGNRIAAWGQTGTKALEFNRPYGVAVDPVSHDIYVAERDNNRVQRITNTGIFVMGWGSLGTAPGQFDAPIGIAADGKGNVYVVDHNNNRVQKFAVSSSGGTWSANLVNVWGGTGAANGQFDAPYGITLDGAGNVWVADAHNHRLQKFDPSGNFLASVGTFGTGHGQFDMPTWVNFDSSGNYYVAETNSDPQNLSATDIQNQRVQKFDSKGTFITQWGGYGDVGGDFKLPFQAVPDSAGNVYVSDYYNTRVQKFTFNSTTPPPPPTNSQFLDVSSRLRTNGNPGRELIAGFVIAGSGPKQLLIRGVGPTLTHLGVTSPLPDPQVQVYSGSTVVAQNDDWNNDTKVAAATTALGAFGLDASSKDSAMLVTLNPGVYTAQVLPKGGDGVALVEVYDVDGSSTAKLVNLSSRGYVDTGDGVLIGGFVVTGTTPKKVMIRGVGPTLTKLGVSASTVLNDPVLKVYDSKSVVIAQNDDWESPQAVSGGASPALPADIAAAETATGAFNLPSGSKDAAVVITLQPGGYSAIVTGSGGTTGTALVEVYEVP